MITRFPGQNQTKRPLPLYFPKQKGLPYVYSWTMTGIEPGLFPDVGKRKRQVPGYSPGESRSDMLAGDSLGEVYTPMIPPPNSDVRPTLYMTLEQEQV